MEKNAVHINMLGTFEVLVNGKAVLPKLQQSKKTRQLLEYLILKQGKSATHAELLENIWADKSNSNPATALRTLLHRYRSMVDEQHIPELSASIVTCRGGYRWNQGLDCVVDAFEMERLIARAGSARQTEKASLLKQAIELYNGPLLPDSADEPWVVTKAAYFRDLYISALFDYITGLKKRNAYQEIVKVCRKALDVEPLEERINIELMMALTKSGRSDDAFTQYRYRSASGETPDDMREMYDSLVKASEQLDNEADKLCQRLRNMPEMEGAYVCEYSVFQELFTFQRRLLERYNTVFFLSMIGITTGEDRSSLAVETMMSKLLEVLRVNLRHGDTVARYGPVSFVLLLPAATYESATAVLARVKDAFYASHTDPSAVVSYSIRPLLPQEEQQ